MIVLRGMCQWRNCDKMDKRIIEVVKRVTVITEEILKYGVGKLGGDQLSAYQVELAALNVFLGEYTAKAVGETNRAYAYRKFTYASGWSPMKDKLNAMNKATDSDVKAAMDIKMKDDVDDHLNKQELADKLKATWDSVQYLINSLAAAIKVKMGERFTPQG